MVGAITAGLGLLTEVGGAIGGAIAGSKAGKQAREIISARKDENKKWYDEKMAEDYLQRSDIQNLLRKQKDLLGEQMKRARATNVVAGGTDEALALQQQGAMETLGETTANVAANAAAYKDSVEQQYRTQDAALDQQMAQSYQQQAEQIGNAAGQLSQAGATMLSSGLKNTDIFNKKKTTAGTTGVETSEN